MKLTTETESGGQPWAHSRTPFLVSFSGIDGAGKSTQIEALLLWLRTAGARVRVLRFWDDVALFSSSRERLGHALFKGDPGVGSPTRPVARRDKNVRNRYMTLLRCFLYLGDTARLAMKIATASTRHHDVLIFDRFIYDELANLNLNQQILRTYAKLVLRLVPTPNCAFVLDAVPEQARARKPEYPVPFLHSNRASYLSLGRLVQDLTVIEAGPVEDVTRSILRAVLARLPASGPGSLRSTSEGYTLAPNHPQ